MFEVRFMLTKIRVQNFALIDDLTLDLEKNLVVFSGETGSGKSILINAISFLIGEKVDKSFVRFGANFAQVEGMFVCNEQTKKVCDELGIECQDEILISRKIKLDGKSENRVNGAIITNSMLKRLTSTMVDIYGQHEHQCLLNENSHIDFVDAIKKPTKLEELSVVLGKFGEINKKLNEFGGDEGKRQREIDILDFEIKELNDAELKEGEEETLLEKQRKFQSVQKVCDSISASLSSLDGGEEFSVLSALSFATKSLNNACDDNEIEQQHQRLLNLQIELEDVKESLCSIMESYNFSESECEEVEARLSVLKNIKRKYGGTIDEAMKYLQEAQKKLEFLQNSDYECQKLEEEKHVLLKEANELCDNITTQRKENAKILEESIQRELAYLGMKNAKLSVCFEKSGNITKNGNDVVKFMFSANKGEPLKPLTSVISGGEMSRFMLAFKVVMGNKNGASTMLFDEIDNGIGGEVGFFVGTKLSEIAKNSQVIVVTHLASIGAMADQHFKVFKECGQRTSTKVVELDSDQKLAEIARLAGGISEGFAYTYAKELKQKAQQLKC